MIPPGYKQTEVGVIPEEWEAATLSELVIYGPKNGYSGQSGKKSRGTPTLSLGATSTGCLVLNEETVKRLDEAIDPRSDLYLKPGDVLVQRSNTPDLVGTTAVFNGPPETYVYPDLMMRMRFRDEATAHWFWRYANSNSGRRFFVSVAAGSSGSMPKISGEKLRAMQLPLPPLPEQRVIATALSDVDALLAALDRLIAKQRDLKQAAMQQLLTGQTRLPGFTGKWETKTLFELAERKKELFDDGDWIESEHITTEGIRLIQTGNISVGRFTEKDAKKYIYEKSFVSLRCKQLRQGDLLVCRLADPAGRACVLPDIGEERVVTSVDVTIFRPPPEMANRVFLANVFSTPEWFRAVSDRSGGTTHKRISRGALGRISITLPPLPEQTAIATVLSDMDAELAALEQRRDKTRALKQGMMQELLTGRTRLL